MSLRLQLLAFGALTLVLPWTGLRFVQEMEGALRSRLQSELIAKAQVVATRDELQALSPAAVTAGGALAIHAHPLMAQPVLDGFRGDWRYRGENSAAAADLRAIELGPNRVWVGTYQAWLYLFFEVVDDEIVYQSLARQINGDRIVLLHDAADAGGGSYGDGESRSSDSDRDDRDDGADGDAGADGNEDDHRADGTGTDQRASGPSMLLIATEAPASSMRAQRVVGSYGTDGSEVAGVGAAWRERPTGRKGYSVEVRMPLVQLNQSLGFGVIDVDAASGGGYSAEFVSQTWGDEPGAGPLIGATVLEQVLSAYVGEGERYRVFDAGGRLLADTGPIEPAAEVEPRNMPMLERFFRFLLRRDEPSYDQPGQAGSIVVPIVRESLTGTPVTAWYRRGPEVGAIVAAAVGVPADTESSDAGTVPRIGTVLLEQASDSVLTTSNAAMMRLMTVTLLVSMITALALLAYASFLSLRVGRLARAAETALGPRGEIKVALPGTGARDEIGNLSRSFEDLLRRLSEYTDYLKSLKSKLSHELRTPLAIVSTSVDNLEHEPGSESGKAYLARLRHGTERLESILQAMTAATRVEQAILQTEVERFDLAAVVASCAASYRDVYADTEFEASLPSEPIVIDGAPELIEQMLDKLVDNAAGFAAPGTNIEIELEAAEDHASLRVSNRGPLLPEAMRHQLFDSLVSVRESDGDKPHLGLGLYIVSLIAEFHDARVTAENLPDGSGVVFSVLIPIVPKG